MLKSDSYHSKSINCLAPQLLQRFNKSIFDTNKVVASKFLAVNLDLCGLLILKTVTYKQVCSQIMSSCIIFAVNTFPLELNQSAFEPSIRVPINSCDVMFDLRGFKLSLSILRGVIKV
ncbi:hypothetical protein BpHYR1_010251 [Brachionus plicatilis]|uniref:Uncharacterized protein n=1 Tax=Brachionus plicatilis TaxID=10195 RepID=A0A3M7PLT0_BRAPC|nr:hypothetical protein BpHYR1_010251 [Brachionus plicatilis]